MAQEMIEGKFVTMIEIFRSEFQKLSPKEKEKEQMINSLKSPCQFQIISSPDKVEHLIIKTHFSEIKDKTIRIIELQGDSFLEQLEHFLEDPIWTKQADDYAYPLNEGESFPRALRGAVVGFGQSIANPFRLKKPSMRAGIGMMRLVNSEFAIWNAYGLLEQIDLDEQARNFVQECKRALEHEERKAKEQPPSPNKTQTAQSAQSEQIRETIPNTVSGLGTFFYPPLLVGKFNPNLKNQIYGMEYNTLNENVIQKKFDDTTVEVSTGGLIMIETKSANQAEKILNTIMGTALILGIPLHSVRTSEIAGISFDVKKNQMTGTSWTESTKRMDLFWSSTHLPYSRYRSDVRSRISIKDMELILKNAENIWKNKENSDMVRLLLGSFTHLDNGDFSQSFIMSWMIIEKNLYDLWRRKLLSTGVSKRIRDDLDRWDVYRVLEVLHLDKIVSEDDYNDLKNLNRIRNDVIHEGYEVTEKQSKDCYKIAEKITEKELEIKAKIKLDDNVMI